ATVMSPLMPLKQSKWATRTAMTSSCMIVQKRTHHKDTKSTKGRPRENRRVRITAWHRRRSAVFLTLLFSRPFLCALCVFVVKPLDQIRQPTRAVAEVRQVRPHAVHQLNVEVGDRRVARVADVPARFNGAAALAGQEDRQLVVVVAVAVAVAAAVQDHAT